MGTEITKEKGGKKTSHYIIQEQEEGPVSIRTKNRPPATNNHIQLRNKHNWRESRGFSFITSSQGNNIKLYSERNRQSWEGNLCEMSLNQ